MTVLRQTPSQLILAHAPWVLGGGLIVCIVACAAAGLALMAQGEVVGLATILAGAGIPVALFALLIKRDQVIFDAHAGTATLQRRTLFVYRCAVHDLAHIDRIMLDTLADTARPILTFRTATPPYPLVEAHISNAKAQGTVALITQWLSDLDRASPPSPPL